MSAAARPVTAGGPRTTPGRAARMRPGTVAAALAVVVAGGAVLRWWAIGQGFPLTNARPDERDVLLATKTFAQGDLNPRWYIYPSLYLYLVAGWDAALLAVRRVFVATPDYRTALETALPTMILFGRMLSAVAGTVTPVLVYVFGRQTGGRALGIVAATLIAGTYLHVRDSHVLKPDVLLGVGVLVSLWLLARYADAPSAGGAAVAGLAIGITTAIKYNGLLLLGPAYLAGVLASRATGVRRWMPDARLALLSAIAGATFLVGCPYLVLDFGHASAMTTLAAQAVYLTRPGTAPAAGAGWVESALNFLRTRAFGYHLWVSLRHGAGLATAVLLPFALWQACRPPRRPLLVLSAAFCVAYYLVAGASPVHLARYFTPLLPLIALLVANLIVTAAARLRPGTTRRAAIAAAVVVVLAEPVRSSIAYDRLAGRTDTRVLATQWMTEHLPRGSVVALLGTTMYPIADPELPPGVKRAHGNQPADFDREHVTHVVTHWHHALVNFSRPDPATLAALAPRLTLLAEMSPFSDGAAGAFEAEDAYYVPLYDFAGVERPGPLIRIYAYTPPAPDAR